MFFAEAMTWPDAVACTAGVAAMAFIIWCVTRNS